MAGREYGPMRLGPLDVMIGLAALRLFIGSKGLRITFWLLLVVFSVFAFLGWAEDDAVLLGIGIGAPSMLFVGAPFLQALSRTEFTLEVTGRGLLVRTTSAEVLYRRIAPNGVRTVLGRLLISVSGKLVLIIPVRQIGEESADEIRRQARALPFIG